jgi:hypothetical protein
VVEVEIIFDLIQRPAKGGFQFVNMRARQLTFAPSISTFLLKF